MAGGGTKHKNSSGRTSQSSVRFLRAGRRILAANDNVSLGKPAKVRKLAIWGVAVVLVVSLVAAIAIFF